MTDLFVIEAPGKARQFEAILRGLGLDAVVQATKGHLYSMPTSLCPVGIDASMREVARAPRDLAIVKRIREEAAKAARVFIATDGDAEGDVIGWDVSQLVADIHPECWRIRLKGMDPESVREALDAAAPVRKEDAIPGRTRAIVDRLIGSVFSRDGVAVGRVGTAMLGLVKSRRPSVLRLVLAAPSKDGGRPWIAECDVRHPLDEATAQRIAALDLPALGVKASAPPAPARPAHMGDIMVRAGDRLDMSPAEVAASMQRQYEAGRLSYPRAGSRGMSRGARRKLERILKQAGYKFEAETIPEKGEADVHDAPYPIGKVDVSRDPRRLGEDEGVRTMIARDLVRSGQTHSVETAVGTSLVEFLRGKGFPEAVARHIAGLDWRREVGPRFPGQEAWPDSGVVARRPDTVLLEAALEAGLGRPSTWARHVEAFMNRGLVDASLGLTAKGEAWIAASPPELLDARMSAAIEKACERILPGMMDDPDREPWEILAERIVRALPESIRTPVTEAAAAEASPPRRTYADDAAMADTLAGRPTEPEASMGYAPDL